MCFRDDSFNYAISPLTSICALVQLPAYVCPAPIIMLWQHWPSPTIGCFCMRRSALAGGIKWIRLSAVPKARWYSWIDSCSRSTFQAFHSTVIVQHFTPYSTSFPLRWNSSPSSVTGWYQLACHPLSVDLSTPLIALLSHICIRGLIAHFIFYELNTFFDSNSWL